MMNEQLQGELLSVHENNQTYPGAPTNIRKLSCYKAPRFSTSIRQKPILNDMHQCLATLWFLHVHADFSVLQRHLHGSARIGTTIWAHLAARVCRGYGPPLSGDSL